MRRHDQRDGVRRPRVLSQQDTRAVPELPPGPLGVPARSWLTLVGNFRPTEKAGPGADRSPQMSMRYRPPAYLSASFDALPASGLLERVWRAERRPRDPARIASYQSALFGAPSPFGGSSFGMPSRDCAARQ
jgi:hypothetical protein